nr:hypothetical protein [uncultured Cohaesibacter sp.]
MTLKLTDPAPRILGENLPFWLTVATRIASLFLMATGILYWVDILGIMGESGLVRGPWQEAGVRVLLACSFLIASVGVWQLTFWGVVMWVLSATAQTASILLMDDFMPHQAFISIIHFIALILLAVACGWIYFKAIRPNEED